MKKSNKQRRAEIKARRLERAAAASAAHLREKDVRLPQPDFGSALGCEPADRIVLGQYNNTYGVLPRFYEPRPFTCRDCGAEEVWTAKQQKWWYEVAKGNIYSQAVRCRPCRRIEQARVAEVRRIAEEGIKRKALEKDS